MDDKEREELWKESLNHILESMKTLSKIYNSPNQTIEVIRKAAGLSICLKRLVDITMLTQPTILLHLEKSLSLIIYQLEQAENNLDITSKFDSSILVEESKKIIH